MKLGAEGGHRVLGLPLLTRLSRRYTLTEGDFHHLKNARLTHLHLPPPALKIVTIHECESSENSLAMTPRLPPPKPGLAIFQVSPQHPRTGGTRGSGIAQHPREAPLGPGWECQGIAGSGDRRSRGAGAPPGPHPLADPLSTLCLAAPRGGPAPASAPQPCRGPQLCPARGHLQLHRGHELHGGQPVRLLRLRGGPLGECWDGGGPELGRGRGSRPVQSQGSCPAPSLLPQTPSLPPAPCQGSGRDVGIQLETGSAPPAPSLPRGTFVHLLQPSSAERTKEPSGMRGGAWGGRASTHGPPSSPPVHSSTQEWEGGWGGQCRPRGAPPDPSPGHRPAVLHPPAAPRQPGRGQPLLQDQEVEAGEHPASVQPGHQRWGGSAGAPRGRAGWLDMCG